MRGITRRRIKKVLGVYFGPGEQDFCRIPKDDSVAAPTMDGWRKQLLSPKLSYSTIGRRGKERKEREWKLDFANFETEPSDGPPDRPNNQRRSDSDRQYDCCEVEIRGCRGEDE